ncbi:LLM class flavin-dependent oxidoreductase [Cellulomonas sp. ATA003]|uniref:LLM class flavin-dependent oxidoreductase n=1 Tax=Cellulomonas sp. ATA003 TaxID=3073064 RepID=UPI0028739A0A|nr:LLM class flavin-dependent oxidoreductase [Cellulomonas sp. ATA003]WNB85264.1 LLM class flavin-dependent oxidoreductase [Cellulomonas sp. ATA003]
MPDLGHPLELGSFLTPTAADPQRVAELAMLSEAVGLDLVTMQDHPYQPGFLDTWTLLSVVAARTTSVRLAPNVASLPLRPPAVLARSVASLDLLSGGRVELGLGAGAFWDAIEAMGAPRLSPGQAVDALAEAVEVIRALWDTSARGGVRVDGEHHHVRGAKRGPAPAHPVEIWLGAYKPRMLALTGRVADGWLPSLGYLQPGDLARGNAIVDDAALEAGRTPADVRRLLNISGRFGPSGREPLHGPPQQWAEELAAFALDDGVSVFILGSDDPDDLRRFAAEVAPAVRELVAAERAEAEAGRAEAGVEADRAEPGRADGGRADGGRTAPERVEAASAAGRDGAASGASGSGAARSTAGTAPRGPGGAVRGGSPFAVAPTPDDGVRLVAEQPWDEASRPQGPAPDADRTYTAEELATGQHLVDVHDHLRAELARVRDLVDQVEAGSMDVGVARSHINTMTMRQNSWVLGTYCESYCRVVTTHHTLEDRSMFPHLRRSDERLAPVIDRLEQEHHVIHDVLEGVDRALVRLVSGPDGMPGLRAAVDLLTDTLLSHLAYEERELVEPLARLGMH